ncbi:aromatic motif membrane protein [Mycoplasma hafezii]|uniref:aromatic motif membrane protein n=1 Tax=Mycoplasma hafezii TaxID=525886 RepID=UPI003CE747CD
MKKFWKISLGLLSSVAVPLSALSCNNSHISYNKPFAQTINHNLKLLTETYFDNNQNELKDFYRTQSQIGNSLIPEYRTSLIFAPLWDQKVLKNADSNTKQTIQSIKNIEQALTNEWFWYLNNLEKLQFVFNPYGNEYSGNASAGNNIFNKFLESDKPLSITLKDSNIQKIYIKDFQLSKYDELKNKKMYFMQIDTNKFLMLLTYQDQNDKKQIFLLPDLYVISNNISVDAFSSKLIEMIQEVNQAQIQKEIDYLKNFDDPINEEAVSKQFNDVAFIKLFSSKNYAQLLSLVIQKMQNDENNKVSFEKYTWGFVNEK